MRTRILVAATVLAALGACKKSEPEQKQKPAATVDAAVAAKPDAKVAAVTVDAAAVQSDAIKPFLYKVEKDGKTGYLFGTMHIGIEPDRVPDYVLAKVDSARTFAMEADLSQQMSLLNDMRLPEGETLEKQLGPDDWKKLVDAIGPQMAQALNGFKPSAMAEFLQLKDLPQTAPMDPMLLERAQKHDAKIVYLEDVKLQAKILDKWFDIRALKEQLAELDKGTSKEKELLDAYAQGDEDKVLAVTLDKSDWKRSEAEWKEQMDDFLYNRNASWIPKVEQMMADGDMFMAVGAAHLIGPGSVTDLLQKKGYTVTRVES